MFKSSSPDPELLSRLDRIEQKLDAVLALLRGGGLPSAGGPSPMGPTGASTQPPASCKPSSRSSATSSPTTTER